jgi:hypothetical protein
MWKNVVWRGRGQMTIWRMRFECCITKSTDRLRYFRKNKLKDPKESNNNNKNGTDTHTHTHTHMLCSTYCFPTTTVVALTLPSMYSTLPVLAGATLGCDGPIDVSTCCLLSFKMRTAAR